MQEVDQSAQIKQFGYLKLDIGIKFLSEHLIRMDA
jgi:hypothetical protein